MLKADNASGSATALKLDVEPGNASMSVSPGAGTVTGLKAEDAAHAEEADQADRAPNAANLGGVAAAD